jgi:hypothetical protein
MKTIFAVLCLFALSAAAHSDDGTVSVLKTVSPAPAIAQTSAPAPVAAQTVACCEVEEARAVKLSPWHTRRLNRIADRQEAREARNCCDSCKESCDCCKKPKALVVEARSKKCNCCK